MTEIQEQVEVVETSIIAIDEWYASRPADVVARAVEVANSLKNIIASQHLYTNIQGKAHVNVEGWTTMGAMLGVLPREVSCERMEDGAYVATVELINAHSGIVVGRASSVCGMDEVWGGRQEYARRSMAITRATGKAYRLGFSWIMKLAGYEVTPAEEMPVEHYDAPSQNIKKAPRPYEAKTVKQELVARIANNPAHTKLASDKQREYAVSLLNKALDGYGAGNVRHAVQMWLYGKESAKDFSAAEAGAIIKWLSDETGDLSQDGAIEVGKILTAMGVNDDNQ